MLEQRDFQSVADMVYRTTEAIIANDQEVVPVVLLVEVDDDHELDGRTLVVEEFFRNDSAKDVMARLLNRIVSIAPPNAIVALVTEAWALELGKGEPIPDIRPRDHPDRYEVVIVNLRTPDFNAAVEYRIDRTGAAPKLIYQPIDWTRINSGGRFNGPEVTQH